MFRTIKILQLNRSGYSCNYFRGLTMSASETINIETNDKNTPESKKRPHDDTENANNETEIKVKKFERIKKKNFAIMLGYLGKDYHGMQRNPQMRTIEEDLIGAMYKAKLIDQEAFETIQNTHFQRAARTDKGVSAKRQICSAKLPEFSKIEDINQYLPKQIQVFGLKRVTKGFNSKSNCNARTYTYTFPTYALAPEMFVIPEDPNTMTPEQIVTDRIRQLQTIEGKPYTEYRAPPEAIEKLNSILKLYEGSHNFHNYTSKIRPFDPRAMRYIMKSHCVSTHISQNMEFATILIRGQSFMLHQIRKMVGFVIGITRNLAPEEMIFKSFKSDKREIPIAPGLGLVLNYVHYDNYDKRYGSDGIHEKLLWNECDDEVEKFYKDFILRHIEETEINENSMMLWLSEIRRTKFGRIIDVNNEVLNEEEKEENADDDFEAVVQ